MALRRRAPAVSYHHVRANCSAGKSPRGNTGLKSTWTDDLKKNSIKKFILN
jgi:hypothetical protein